MLGRGSDSGPGCWPDWAQCLRSQALAYGSDLATSSFLNIANIDIHLQFGLHSKLSPSPSFVPGTQKGQVGVLHLRPTLSGSESAPCVQPWESGFGVFMLPKGNIQPPKGPLAWIAPQISHPSPGAFPSHHSLCCGLPHRQARHPAKSGLWVLDGSSLPPSPVPTSLASPASCVLISLSSGLPASPPAPLPA